MRRVALAVFGTIAGLVGLLSFKTHTSTGANPPAIVSTVGPTTADSTAPATTSPGGTTATTGGSTTAGPKTYTGNSIDTRWGPVQVRITVTSGKLSGVSVIKYPNGNGRDAQINSYALPALTKEALAAGSAQIDMISGATYTSTGYIDSLQSALNKAGL